MKLNFLFLYFLLSVEKFDAGFEALNKIEQ